MEGNAGYKAILYNDNVRVALFRGPFFLSNIKLPNKFISLAREALIDALDGVNALYHSTPGCLLTANVHTPPSLFTF